MKTLFLPAALALLFSSLLHAQDAPKAVDPYAEAPIMVRIQTEFIQMAHKDATRLLMEDKAKNYDATELRMKVQKMVDGNEAQILDTQVIHTRSGEKATAESILEYIYPTEYDAIPLQEPASADGTSPKTPSAAAPLPVAFETRNTGSTLEVEATVGAERTLINLRYIPELVTHTGNNSWREVKDAGGNINKVEMPDFYTMRVNAALTCISGQYTLNAVLSPKDKDGKFDHEHKVMLFVKCTILPVAP